MKSKSIMDQLVKEVEYAQRSMSRDLLLEIFGKAKMARQFDVITFDEFMEINHNTIYFINTHAREVS